MSLPIIIVEIKDKRLNLEKHRVFTSLEGENPGGSIKDRMVYNEISNLLKSNALKEQYEGISEVSAGSTALSLAYYCKKMDIKCHLFLPEDASQEKIDKLKSLGANLYIRPRATIYADHAEFCLTNKTYYLNQLEDKKKRQGYYPLGSKFYEYIRPIDIVIGAIGTGHSLMGVAEALPNSKLMSSEPSKDFFIPGIRNIEHERYGENDPCTLNMVKERQILPKYADLFPFETIETNLGSIVIGDSFRLVLGAVSKILVNENEPKNVVAIGAENRRVSKLKT